MTSPFAFRWKAEEGKKMGAERRDGERTKVDGGDWGWSEAEERAKQRKGAR